MSFKYLNSKQHYEDRYDLSTIKQCLDQLKMLGKISKKMELEPKIKNYPKSELERNMGLMGGRLIFVVKAHRYKERDSRIAEWMKADRAKQDKLDTPPPKIDCPDCKTQMISDDSPTLQDWPEDQPMRVLFILNCPKCKKRNGAYDDGEIYVSKSNFCPECNEKLSVTNSRKAKIITTLYKCKHCSYSKKNILDLAKDDVEHKKWQKEQNKKEKEDQKLLIKYREKFCLSKKEGEEYVETLEAMEVGNEVYKEKLAELDTPAHEKLLSLNKISISDLETMLNKALDDSEFSRLSFGNPDMDRYVLVPFTVQDNKPKRRDGESIYDLYKLLKVTLKGTNWRAPKNSFRYRLGFISGKIRGYDSKEELLKLFGREEPKKPKSKFDPKLREKYEHHNIVQMQKMNAEFETEKRIRTRRLKDEPDGFYLNDGGRGYTCGICRNHHDGEDIWWRTDGLRCRNCWKNIQEGVIPMFDLEAEWWEEEFFGKYDIPDRGVHINSIKRLRREGVLVGRDLKDFNDRTYETVYLIEENKSFLEKYQKKSDV